MDDFLPSDLEEEVYNVISGLEKDGHVDDIATVDLGVHTAWTRINDKIRTVDFTEQKFRKIEILKWETVGEVTGDPRYECTYRLTVRPIRGGESDWRDVDVLFYLAHGEYHFAMISLVSEKET